MSARNGWLLICGFVTFACFVSPMQSRADGIERRLRDDYEGKELILRGFSPGSRLHYDADGTLVGAGRSGDWTSDGFVQIKSIRTAHHQMILEAERLLVIQWDGNQFDFLRDHISGEDKHPVEIKIDLDLRTATPQQANVVLARIF